MICYIMKSQVEVYVDGASRGNPGPSAIGVYIKDSSGKEILKRGEYLGETTNNVAEYQALVKALKYLLSQGREGKGIKANQQVVIYTDSELIINQLNGTYRIRSRSLIPLAIEARRLIKKIKAIEFKLIERKDNKIADKLANRAMNLEGEVNEPVLSVPHGIVATISE
ncbi:MAG: ribonuclease HI family protein [Planctomycetota bacterium]|nr:ribonuclease HI family protein [Planctomycetota bacterium]MDI6787446.1 ribonuclease HI family protein [Planctomycetota bacterium]